jgi:hypothetical protein
MPGYAEKYSVLTGVPSIDQIIASPVLSKQYVWKLSPESAEGIG